MSGILVIGCARTGVAVAERLRVEGLEVTVVEENPGDGPGYADRAARLRACGATLVEGPAPVVARDLVAAAELVVPSPLVAPDHPLLVSAASLGVPVRAEIDLAAERAAVPLVAVTGTNGKTTVTSLTATLLAASGRNAAAAGNIGRPLIEAVSDPGLDVIVAEVSSFQLEFAPGFRPAVAVVLAVTPDHLDWHGGFDRYVAAKARITAGQGADDLLVFDADDPVASGIAAGSGARRVGVSVRPDALGCARVADGDLVAPDGAVIAPVASLRRALSHDLTNALAAATAAGAAGATAAGIRAGLADYETMPHRVALVGESGGVRWYDDSKATNPDATLRAVSSFPSVVLLAGGRNKGLDLGVLAERADRLRGVVAFGEAAPEVAAAFAPTGTPVVIVGTVPEAVSAAVGIARPGDAVLLSPACASFDAYDGYAARGDDFAGAVRGRVLGGTP